MIFRKANSKDEDTIKQITSRAYQKYIERMGKEPAPMRPNIQKNDIVFVCEKENKIIAFAILVIKDGITKPTEAEVNAKIQELKDADADTTTKKTSGKQKLKDLGLDDAEIKALIGA